MLRAKAEYGRVIKLNLLVKADISATQRRTKLIVAATGWMSSKRVFTLIANLQENRSSGMSPLWKMVWCRWRFVVRAFMTKASQTHRFLVDDLSSVHYVLDNGINESGWMRVAAVFDSSLTKTNGLFAIEICVSFPWHNLISAWWKNAECLAIKA